MTLLRWLNFIRGRSRTSVRTTAAETIARQHREEPWTFEQ